MSLTDKRYAVWFAVVLSFLAYGCLGYLVPRDNFALLIGCYAIAFISFYYLYNTSNISEKELFGYGISFRIILLFCLPFWSQDFYRFIWDGRILLSGVSPYEFRPDDIISNVSIFQSQELYQKMGSLSTSHFSNYPPLNQFLFSIVAFLSPKSIFFSAFFLKVFILFSDIGIYYFGKKLLQLLFIKTKRVFLYFLNPLVILELAGNTHFEGVMLFFLILGLYYFFLNRWLLAAFCIALSISVKLLPLLLLPFVYHKLGFKKSFFFCLIVILFNILFFLPFLTNSLIQNYSETIALWFVNFEFNASFYYFFREIGYWIKGYNTIGIIGKITPVFTIIMILFFALVKENRNSYSFFINSLFALTCYFLISTTVHPWYVINLIILSLFTKYRFAIVWSFTIILSYFAYSQTPFQENMILIFLEYVIVLGFLYYEFFKNNKNKTLKLANNILV
ncbi:Mannosyltransferase [Flavobacterium sp. 9AF]|uniref:polyprenol phosphomannose-dependent alpha 1,6 mannosyltransferase MptB n=1 Tax=Flavobacterium sp. 9AF TaxID=2653142 RepID=UPI0012F19503|nr:polyprenol phosphomannose-dependent alpha 1,6 mannosyltransferase MptB [Flavobacterium sp. 9AF]VXA93677.1 Mannosyltransferase [Flavobacterium sp. 9AF]